MKTKICRTCKKRKLIKNFHIKRSNKDGINNQCKQCKNKYSKILHNQNKNIINQKKKEYYQKHKSKIKIKHQNYYVKNKTYLLAKCKEYKIKNREKINNYHCNRRKKDKQYSILHSLRVRLYNATKGRLSDSTKKLIGCSLSDLKIHLEKQFKNGMNWENYGRKGWHIDHIKPCTSFDLTDPKQQRECFNYTNLQPLWACENISKGNKILPI